jgi:bacterioferritin-associated ferredoxin
MNLDDNVCYCFHVTRRKLENYVRREHPQVVSQLTQCGGAGTGCGWCIPFLKQIFNQNVIELDQVSPSDYAAKRATYVKSGRGTPPAGAEPLPE